MAEKIKTDIDEIVFEKRNKEYGAYYLRKAYNRFVTRALTAAVIALALAVIIPFLIFKQAHSVNVDKEVGVVFTDMNKPPEDAPPPPPPPPPPEALEQKVKFTAPVVTADSVEDTGALNQDDLSQQSTTTAVTEETEIVVEETQNQVIEQAAPILTIVELMPGFDGGEEKMYAWLGENIKYPQIAKETNITGTVIVTFVVEKDGSISNVQVLKDIGGGCGEEAVRVVKNMPKWKPGKQNGVPVRVQFNLPIRFTLE
ncbi:MAG TPA: TonB family protein [Bacteroidales bacterium]|nr:TonB family protein [Bacteroidales bacterium]HPS17466.1 TonB family protein [Bacteroidales bacterium]